MITSVLPQKLKPGEHRIFSSSANSGPQLKLLPGAFDPTNRARTVVFIPLFAPCPTPLSNLNSRRVGSRAPKVHARFRVMRRLPRPVRGVRMASSSPASSQDASLSTEVLPPSHDKGTLLLCLLNLLGFCADKLLHFPYMTRLYLNHNRPQWFQLVTSLFCHGSFQHLTGNLFLLLVFGRFVEEEAGATGVVLAYLLCGACANIASLLLLRGGGIVSLGASGSVFALFTLAILVRFRIRLARLVETFILSTYVSSRVTDEFKMVASNAAASSATVNLAGTPVRVNHVAHIAGALAGVFLVLLLNFFLRHSNPPSEQTKKSIEEGR